MESIIDAIVRDEARKNCDGAYRQAGKPIAITALVDGGHVCEACDCVSATMYHVSIHKVSVTLCTSCKCFLGKAFVSHGKLFEGV